MLQSNDLALQSTDNQHDQHGKLPFWRKSRGKSFFTHAVKTARTQIHATRTCTSTARTFVKNQSKTGVNLSL